jgi:hypothetical protein
VRPWWETDNMIPDSTPHGLEVAILMQDGRWEFYPPAQLQEVSV